MFKLKKSSHAELVSASSCRSRTKFGMTAILFGKTAILFGITVNFLFLLVSCKSTPTLDHISLNKGDFYVVTDELEQKSEDGKYIFFRLYNPEYSNPLYIANLLKGGLNATHIKDTPNVSHASINFSLNDDFYGLSLGGKYQLKHESCMHPETNDYMKHCDPKRSEQITYALKVSEQEFEDAKKFVEFYANDTRLKYKSSINFRMARFSIKRKYFTKEEKQQFGSITYKKNVKNKHVSLETDQKIEKNFVCSTFVGFVLYNNVPAVADYFDEKEIKYEYLNVADVAAIPGVEPLFYSTWEDYDLAVADFVEKFPEFKKYY